MKDELNRNSGTMMASGSESERPRDSEPEEEKEIRS
jgi:hypothetical protein